MPRATANQKAVGRFISVCQYVPLKNHRKFQASYSFWRAAI